MSLEQPPRILQLLIPSSEEKLRENLATSVTFRSERAARDLGNVY